MTDLDDYQREAAVLRRCRRLLRLYAGTSEYDQETARWYVLGILADYAEAHP